MIEGLIYDRTQADKSRALQILQKLADNPTADIQTVLSADEYADYMAGLRGCYNDTDMNRVEAACRTLAAELEAAGYPVEYVPAKTAAYSLASVDFQQAPYLYASGAYNANSDRYISTINYYSISGEPVTVTANVAIGSDSGFLWYNNSKAFISGAPSKQISGTTMTATPPSGAAYCKFNINLNGVTPSAITEATLRISASDAWTINDTMQLPQYRQYLANVRAIRDAFLPDSDFVNRLIKIPSPDDKINFEGANDIERSLVYYSKYIDWMKHSYRICGAFKCGSNAEHLPLKRSVT